MLVLLIVLASVLFYASAGFVTGLAAGVWQKRRLAAGEAAFQRRLEEHNAKRESDPYYSRRYFYSSIDRPYWLRTAYKPRTVAWWNACLWPGAWLYWAGRRAWFRMEKMGKGMDGIYTKLIDKTDKAARPSAVKRAERRAQLEANIKRMESELLGLQEQS